MSEPVRFLGTRPLRPAAGDKHLAEDDPYALVGVRFPVPDGVDGDRELARCFVEEYALMGWPAPRIRALFEDPAYTGAHEIVRRRGITLVDTVIAQVFAGRSRREAT